MIRLLLERRDEFALFGGVRFGGTLTADDALEMGFDHVALAAGAGRPTVLDLPNGLARGVRAASDFLMALQLSGAAQANSVANMQLRLPVVVRGGGLVSQKTSILTGLLQDEKDASVVECFQKHGWNGTEFDSMPDFPTLDEVLCSIGNIPHTSVV